LDDLLAIGGRIWTEKEGSAIETIGERAAYEEDTLTYVEHERNYLYPGGYYARSKDNAKGGKKRGAIRKIGR